LEEMQIWIEALTIGDFDERLRRENFDKILISGNFDGSSKND